MVNQGSNIPIILVIEDKEKFSRNSFRATLWGENGQLLKLWTNQEGVLFHETASMMKITLPLEQSETKDFPCGKATLEAKWLKDGEVLFSEPILIDVKKRYDNVEITPTEIYSGPYSIIPKAFTSTIVPCKNKKMRENIVVLEIPYFEVASTTEGGTSVYIASRGEVK